VRALENYKEKGTATNTAADTDTNGDTATARARPTFMKLSPGADNTNLLHRYDSSRRGEVHAKIHIRSEHSEDVTIWGNDQASLNESGHGEKLLEAGFLANVRTLRKAIKSWEKERHVVKEGWFGESAREGCRHLVVERRVALYTDPDTGDYKVMVAIFSLDIEPGLLKDGESGKGDANVGSGSVGGKAIGASDDSEILG
jgi:hypothetical protein